MTPDPPKRLFPAASSRSGKIIKISSADSLLAMFKNLGENNYSNNVPNENDQFIILFICLLTIDKKVNFKMNVLNCLSTYNF